MKRLFLSRHDKKLTGLCGGVAEYFGIDPTIVRLGTLAIALITGGGFILFYFIASLFVPKSPY